MVLKGWVRWTLGRKMWSTLNLSREQKSWKRERKCKTFKPQLVSIVLVNFMLCLYWMFYDSISPFRLDVSSFLFQYYNYIFNYIFYSLPFSLDGIRVFFNLIAFNRDMLLGFSLGDFTFLFLSKKNIYIL